MTSASSLVEPRLPCARGPLSLTVLELLTSEPSTYSPGVDVPGDDSDPYGLDLQLALYTCYELHYRGFAGINPLWEWNPTLLALRSCLEDVFLAAIRRDVGQIGPDETAAAEMDALSVEPVDGQGLSHFLRDDGTWEQIMASGERVGLDRGALEAVAG